MTAHPLLGSPAPPFTLFDQDMNRMSLEDLQGRKALVVFIPLPFTNTCLGEMCTLRDQLTALNDIDAGVVAITTHAPPTNKRWSDDHQFGFPVLSDYWPHGAVASAYGTFNERLGIADRSTYVLDADGLVRDVITSEFSAAREYDHYVEALTQIA
jgi:peroxiredoxin (alkyl hydroperoxide reductase subunit C)